ncbi:MAG: nitrous oxide reductase accessory protein NosL [bacterium]
MSENRVSRRAALRTGMLLAVVSALDACAAAGPRSIAYGHDECAFCRMTVSEPRFAAAMVSTKGRTLVFDSAECLASYHARHQRDARSLWVSDYLHPGSLVSAERARFNRASGQSSPMGKGLMAFSSARDAMANRAAGNTQSFGWSDVLALVQREGLARGTGASVDARL